MKVRKRKALKIMLLVVIILVAIITVAGIYMGYRWKGIIQEQLETRTQQASNGFYRVKIGEMRVEILRRRVKIDDILFYPDSAAFVHLRSIDSLPPFFVNIALGSVEVQGIRLKNRMLRMGKLWIDAPNIHMTQTSHKKEKPTGDTIPGNLYQLIVPVLHSIDIGEVSINKGSLHYTAWKPDDTTRYRIDHFELKATRFLLDSTLARREKLYCDDIRLTTGPFSYALPNGLFTASFDKMEAGLTDSTLAFSGVKLTPLYGKRDFAAKNPRHTNWMKLSVDSIRCLHVDYRRLISGKAIGIDSVSITGVLYANMKNREVEQVPIAKPMLYEYVQRMPLPLHIRRIHTERAIIVYEDLPRNETTAGTVKFGKMDGDFYDITNVVTRKNQYMTVKARAYVQDEGILRATFKFPVDPDNDHFEITGNMGRMHLPQLNPMFEAFCISIKKGMTESIDFIINGNKQQARLDMTFRYNDLYIALLKEKDHQLFRRSLVSGIANGMVLFNNNPDAGREPRQAETVTERNTYRASFHYFWHTLMDGLKETIGITKKRQAQFKWLKDEAVKMHILKEE